jgi:Protein of unknown function (DUF2934)
MVRRRQIARRAYELYLERGCREHRDQQDWFEAEREIRGKPGPVHMHRLWEVHEMIARRAYELYLDRSRQDGNAEEDWLRAEAEVYALPDLFSRAHAFYLSQGNGWGLMRRRAYVHYLRRNGQNGNPQDDWEKAEEDVASGGWWYTRSITRDLVLCRSNFPFEVEELPVEPPRS